MKSILSFTAMTTFALIILGAMLITTPEDAQAKRFGMGSSFGKSFSKPASSPRHGFSQKAASNKPAGKASPARGGMMGMLGGLALGGLLGAMFFGGAFGGINLFDILIIGAIAFMIISFMRRKATAHNHAYAGAQPQQAQVDAFMQQENTASVGHTVRPNIDQAHFIAAAKDIFVRMQASWDNKNMDDIRKFCSPEIANRIAADLHALGDKKTLTEVGTLDATLVDSWVENNDAWVAVQFNALLNEETQDATGQVLEKDAQNINEMWLFRQPQNTDDPTWYLAGIQQA